MGCAGRANDLNIALEIDRARNYINPYLLDYGLVEKISPDEDAGRYELTERSFVAYEYRAEYRDDSVAFDDLRPRRGLTSSRPRESRCRPRRRRRWTGTCTRS